MARAAEPMIYHLCGAADWQAALVAGRYTADSLATEGFIHCSTAGQVHLPANRLMRGRADLVVLEIDEDALEAPVRYEPGVSSDPETMRFPHVYGPIPVTAVVGTRPYRPGPDGVFAPLS